MRLKRSHNSFGKLPTPLPPLPQRPSSGPPDKWFMIGECLRECLKIVRAGCFRSRVIAKCDRCRAEQTTTFCPDDG